MTQFNAGDKVRVNEGLLEGQTGTVVVSNEHVTQVKLEDVAFGGGPLSFYTETLVSGDEDHPALHHLKWLYPDFLKAPKSNNYRFRITLHLDGLNYVTDPISAESLKYALAKPPAGLSSVEFMLKQDDPNRGLAWKLLWSE